MSARTKFYPMACILAHIGIDIKVWKLEHDYTYQKQKQMIHSTMINTLMNVNASPPPTNPHT